MSMTVPGALIRITRPAAITLAAMALMFPSSPVPAEETSEADRARWQEVANAYFPGRRLEPAGAGLRLEAPRRAADAAIVPISVQAGTGQAADPVTRLHLIIDDNPVPRAFVAHFGPQSAGASIETRVRINEYTHVHAVAETAAGRLLEASTFVRASGGCSAPALKDPDDAMARLGRMKLNLPPVVRAGEPARAQLLISHPNSSGLQFDQISRTYIPAHYVERIRIHYNGRMVTELETDISLSEDPSVHFTFLPEQEGVLEAETVDSKGGVFRGQWPVKASGTGPA